MDQALEGKCLLVFGQNQKILVIVGWRGRPKSLQGITGCIINGRWLSLQKFLPNLSITIWTIFHAFVQKFDSEFLGSYGSNKSPAFLKRPQKFEKLSKASCFAKTGEIFLQVLRPSHNVLTLTIIFALQGGTSLYQPVDQLCCRSKGWMNNLQVIFGLRAYLSQPAF